ncbi:MAG: hypothetical protein WC716_15820 [Chitinophagaceae bacterium]
MKNKFMKFIGPFAVAAMMSFSALAQNAREVSIEINNAAKTGYQQDYKIPKSLMKTTLDDRFKKAGISGGKKSKGYMKYTGVNFPELSPNKIDIYTKISGKKDNSAVLMLVSTGYDNFISTTTDPTIAANTIVFLNNLNEDAIKMKKAIELEIQQKELKKAEEKLKKADAEKAKLEKKKANLEKKMMG